MSLKKLCDISDLGRTAAKSVEIEIDGVITDLFVVRNDKGLFCYIDHCPHLGSPLAWQEDEYLDEKGNYIICATHAAFFVIDSGLCVSGPCVKQSLTSLPIQVIDDEIFLV